MIIKSLTRKSGGAGSLIGYMFRKDKMLSLLEYQMRGGILSPYTVKHMLKGSVPSQWAGELMRNQGLRLKKRKGMVLCYHEIISFHAADSPELDDRTLMDIARTYILKRSPEAPALSVIHKDAEHFHLHFAIAGTKGTGYANRLSKRDFNRIKREMEAYQSDKYPRLTHSTVNHGRGGDYQSGNESRSAAKGQSKKEAIRQKLESVFSQVASSEELEQYLREEGMPIYKRGGKTYGVTVDGRNYRFSTLGFKEALSDLERADGELGELDDLRNGSELYERLDADERLRFLNGEDNDLEAYPDRRNRGRDLDFEI